LNGRAAAARSARVAQGQGSASRRSWRQAVPDGRHGPGLPLGSRLPLRGWHEAL